MTGFESYAHPLTTVVGRIGPGYLYGADSLTLG